LASDEPVSSGAAMRFACTKWRAFFSAPLWPLLGCFSPRCPFWRELDVAGGVGVFLVALIWPVLWCLAWS